MNSKQLRVSVFFMLVISNSVFASLSSDSLYIKSFSDKISTRVFVGVKELAISISNSSKLRSVNSIIYKPNNGIVGGFGVSFRNILISYYFKIPGTELSTSKFGNTLIRDYHINLTTRFFYFSVFQRTYKGFYVSKPSKSYPDWEDGMSYPQRPDIIFTTSGIETIINLNPSKYSLNASLKLTERQLQSVFSGLIYANYSLTSVQGDSSLIPSDLQSSFFDGRELYQTNFSGWTIMPGISYILIKGNWFINPMIYAGIGFTQKELLFANNESSNYNDYYIKVNGRLNCGYNSNRFLASAFIEWNKTFLPEENLMIKTENFNAMLMFGIRF